MYTAKIANKNKTPPKATTNQTNPNQTQVNNRRKTQANHEI